MKTKNPTLSDELIIYRFNNGVKLIRPDQTGKYDTYHLAHNSGFTIEQVFNQTFSFYLLDGEGVTQKMSDEGALICGFESASQSIGKSLYDVAVVDSASKLIGNCNEVMRNNQIKIYDEENILRDSSHAQFLSIKSPWYNDENKIIGTFGCSVVLGKHSLSEALVLIKKLGLMNYDSHAVSMKTINHHEINNIAISNREMDCLRYAIKGYTAKRTAQMLGVSHRTVEDYLNSAKMKLGAVSKAELIELAVDYYLKINAI